MRTDNDTWDITSSVGATALFVAAARALEANKAGPLVVDPHAEFFCRAVGGEWADVLDGKAPENKLMSDFGKHFVNYQAARTKYFDEFFYAATDAGVRQIVILAAGLDSRAYRLAWPAGTVVFELDQPQVLEFKRSVLAQRGEAPTAERREIAVDLRDDWPAALAQSGFDPSRPSAWLAEGLLVYLPAAAQGELFAGIDDLAAPGSRAAVDDGKPFSDELFQAARDEERTSGDGAKFFSLIYNEQHAPAIDWFTNRGWRGSDVELPEYCRQVARPVPGPDSEAEPMFASVSLVSAVKAAMVA
jgi:methyltransferase (TIGR00027 family)